ncbi:hypothetical protein ACLKA7_005977 [Drosophila subpalustris]
MENYLIAPSSPQLRAEMRAQGMPNIPITKTTRNILMKRLHDQKKAVDAVDEEEDDSDDFNVAMIEIQAATVNSVVNSVVNSPVDSSLSSSLDSSANSSANSSVNLSANLSVNLSVNSSVNSSETAAAIHSHRSSNMQRVLKKPKNVAGKKKRKNKVDNKFNKAPGTKQNGQNAVGRYNNEPGRQLNRQANNRRQILPLGVVLRRWTNNLVDNDRLRFKLYILVEFFMFIVFISFGLGLFIVTYKLSTCQEPPKNTDSDPNL